MRKACLLAAVMIASWMFVSCSREPSTTSSPEPIPDEPRRTAAATLRLDDVAADRGLVARHDRGAAGRRHLFEVMGGGIAWIDFDTDGDLDVFLPQGQPLQSDGSFPRAGLSRLFRNDLGRFTDQTAGSGLEGLTGYALGAAVGDVDNDGDADLYVIRFGANVLFLNDGGRFREKLDSGAEGAAEPFHASAAFGDLDRNGTLDLFAAGYLEYNPRLAPACSESPAGGGPPVGIYCGPNHFQGALDRLFLGRGDGTFHDATASAGIQRTGSAASKSLGVLLADLDGDLDLDVYVAADTTANLLYRNRGDARFDEVGLIAGVAASDLGAYEGSMGIAAGDVDADGLLDIFVTNYEEESNRLYRSRGEGFFEDATDRWGAGASSWPCVGWGAALEDLDLDGDLDLYVANGHIFDNVESWKPARTYRQKNLLYRLDAVTDSRGLRFAPVGQGAGQEGGQEGGSSYSRARSHRGVAPGDFDQDGDVDLLVVAIDEPLALLENKSERRGAAFLVVSLVGSGPGGRDAVGARVDVECSLGRLRRWRLGGGSYLSAGDSRLNFGLGSSAKIESLRVTWPDGSEEKIEPAPPVNSFVRIEKGKGGAAAR